MIIKLEDLKVYQISEEIADSVWNICIDWQFFEKDTIGKQFVRSVDSIGANIAEGYGRFSFKENMRFCYFARGSLMETQHWLRRAKKRKLLSGEQEQILEELLQPFHIKLNAYIKSIRLQSEKYGSKND